MLGVRFLNTEKNTGCACRNNRAIFYETIYLRFEEFNE